MARILPMEFLGPAVRQIRKEKRLTLEAVANQVPGYDSGNMSRFERGAQSIDAEKLQDIAKVLGYTVSEIYLLAEKLERLAKPPAHAGAITTENDNQIGDRVAHYKTNSVLAYPSGSRLQSASEDLRRSQELPASNAWEFVLIPSVVVATDADGRSTINVDQANPSHPVPRAIFEGLGVSQDHARLLTVQGDAMNTTLAHGDIALLDIADANVQSGRVYALLVQDEIWVRRVMKTPSGVTLSADNKSGLFEDFSMGAAEFKELKIIGRVRMRWGSSGL